MKIFDVTNASINEDEVVMALFDLRYNSIVIVKPIIDTEGNPTFEITEPDGADRLYWQEKFGMITEEDFQVEAEKLQPQMERVKLLGRLKKELEEPSAPTPEL